MKDASPQQVNHPLLNLDAHHRLALGLVGGALGWWLAPADMRGGARLLVAWDGFCAVVLALIWFVVSRADAAHIRRVATRQDPGTTWVFAVVVVATGASLLAVALLLHGFKEMPPATRGAHALTAAGAVLGAWLLLHTLFTLRYAHVYYGENKTTVPSDQQGGLLFPGDPPTTYWDFAYFAFVVGMTAQTADTGVTTRRMRKLTLLHGVLSFAFNTTIIALGVNVVAGLL